MRGIWIALAVAGALAGCAYPRASVSEGAPAGKILVRSGAPGSTVMIDGKAAGARANPKGDLFAVGGGRHVVETSGPGALRLRREVFVEPGATVIISETP